jgi:AcrR family transcriptional regulator
MKQVFKGFIMATLQDNKGEMGVRQRLLDAAEGLFAERGFEKTSIRDLASSAGCNIASVNYYFGGKVNLYAEVCRRHLVGMTETRLASIEKVMAESGGEPALEDLLRSFAYAFIGPFVSEEGGERLIRLILRETIESHLPSGMFGKEVIEPTLNAMQEALSKACPELDPARVPLIVFSLVGQLLHTVRIKSMQHCMCGDDGTLEMWDADKVIDHIVAFTIAGIEAYTREKGA